MQLFDSRSGAIFANKTVSRSSCNAEADGESLYYLKWCGYFFIATIIAGP